MTSPGITPIEPEGLLPSVNSYTHGALVDGASRILFVSGQVPETVAEPPPPDFESQCRLAWRNVLAVLAEAGLAKENLAKVTVFLSSREYREANSRIREEVLQGHTPALTIIIADIYAEKWLLEIEAVAVA